MTEKRLPGSGAAHFEKTGRASGEDARGEPAPTPRIAQVRPPKYDFHAFESKWRAGGRSRSCTRWTCTVPGDLTTT